MAEFLFKEIKHQSQNEQNIKSGEMANRLFETYKNSVMMHGRHSYQTESAMAMATLYKYPPSQHVFATM